MERKREQFCNLVQGTKTVTGYSKEFTKLARYAGDEVSTDAKKQKRFRNGLIPTLKYALLHVKTDTFEQLVNAAIQEESGRRSFEESRKHSRDIGAPSALIAEAQGVG
jgi:Retrotransposon gag protein.